MNLLKRISIRLVLVIALGGYVGTYYLLSRTSAARISTVGGVGFYYAPVSLDTLVESPTAQAIHYIGIVAFYPIWLIDSVMFNGPGYAHIPHTEGFEWSEVPPQEWDE